MPWIGGAIAGAGALGAGGLGFMGASKQSSAMKKIAEEMRRQYDATVARLQPYTQFGGEQLNALSGWLQDPSKQPMSYLDPGYEFRRTEGMKGLTGNAATAGLLQSGDTLRAAQRYGQDLSSSEYGNAFNRWLGEGTFRQGLAGMGQSAAANQGYLGNQAMANIGNVIGRSGQDLPFYALGNSLAGAGGSIGNAVARYLEANKTKQPTEDVSGIGPTAGAPGWSDSEIMSRFLASQQPGGANIFGWDDRGAGGG